MYVYIQSEPTLWTVGFYKPDGKWEPESDHGNPDKAAKRAAWLNGGSPEPAIDPWIAEQMSEDSNIDRDTETIQIWGAFGQALQDASATSPIVPIAYLVAERRGGRWIIGDDWSRQCDTLDEARKVAADWRLMVGYDPADIAVLAVTVVG